MIISQIELHHFRNYDHLLLTPHGGINIFYGQNGSGKTNLLEAIHYCSLGKSHRINQDQNAVQAGESGAGCRMRIKGRWSENDLEIHLTPREDAVKTVWIDQKKIGRLSEMMGILRCVIFSPEDLSLMKDGPSVRRRFLDMMISQINRGYFISLQQYRIALNQRNAILKQARMENRPINPMIEDFEMAMAAQADLICRERQKYTEILSELGQKIYRGISGREDESFLIQYLPSIRTGHEGPDQLLTMLKENREDDLRQGTTTAGPHRDDLNLSLNHKVMKNFASQGQMRTGALSLKLAQMKIIQNMTDDQPVLLLDDVMSELDLKRRMNLLEMIEGVQTFITCSDETDLASYQNNRTYQVYSENGMARMNLIKQGVAEQAPAFQEPLFQ